MNNLFPFSFTAYRPLTVVWGLILMTVVVAVQLFVYAAAILLAVRAVLS